MDHLKGIGKAIRNSPRMIRKKFGHDHGQHHKLEDDWYHSQDPVVAGVTFYAKYLGSTEVSVTHGAGSTDEPVKKIINHAKHRDRLQKVEITISSKFVKLVDISHGQKIKLDEIPLYRVSYCTVDPFYDKVFAYIARNSETKKLECHCFLCSSRSKAEAITLTVAQAFNIAYEQWNKKKKSSVAEQKPAQDSTEEVDSGDQLGDLLTLHGEGITIKKSCEDDDDDELPSKPPPQHLMQRRQSKDDHMIGMKSQNLEVKPSLAKAVSLECIGLDDNFDAEFSVLAEARSNPHLLPLGDHIGRSPTEEPVRKLMQSGDKDTKSVEDVNLLGL